MGLEPTSGGTTIHCLNHLATLAIVLPILACVGELWQSFFRGTDLIILESQD
jgi:hypothetical protein